jgi:hypothetical protein
MLSLTMNASSAWQKQGHVRLFFQTVKGFAFFKPVKGFAKAGSRKMQRARATNAFDSKSQIIGTYRVLFPFLD